MLKKMIHLSTFFTSCSLVAVSLICTPFSDLHAKERGKPVLTRSLSIPATDFTPLDGSASFNSVLPSLALSVVGLPSIAGVHPIAAAIVTIPADFSPDDDWSLTVGFFTANESEVQTGLVTVGVSATLLSEADGGDRISMEDLDLQNSLIGSASTTVKTAKGDSPGTYYSVKIPGASGKLQAGATYVMQVSRSDAVPAYTTHTICIAHKTHHPALFSNTIYFSSLSLNYRSKF